MSEAIRKRRPEPTGGVIASTKRPLAIAVADPDAPVPDEAVEAVAALLFDVIEKQDAEALDQGGTAVADGDPEGTRGTRGAR